MFLFILLRIDASSTLEVAAEIGGRGETELEGGLLDCLFGIHVHDKLRLCSYILLNPCQSERPLLY